MDGFCCAAAVADPGLTVSTLNALDLACTAEDG
jgi:hypothetical protein